MNDTIQRILVPLDPSDFTEAATLRACEIARKHHAQVEGLVVLDTPEIRSATAPAQMAHLELVQDAVRKAITEASGTIQDVKRRFVEMCEAERVSHTEHEIEGVPASLILETGSLFDLIVMGLRTAYHFETRPDDEGDSLTHILDRTSTPVLAVPRGRRKPMEKVLVAYDGSFSAARALRDFTGFAHPFDFEVRIFVSDRDPATAEMLFDRAAAHLHSHGFTDPGKIVTPDPPKSLLDHPFFVEDADLVVAGIHAKKFFKDAFVGSLTQRLIDHGHTALFLSH